MTPRTFTWQEIESQPQTWRSTLDRLASQCPGLRHFLSQTRFQQALMVGCGSTYYLAQTAAATFAHRTGLPTNALASSELWLFPPPPLQAPVLLVAISRSGSTTETLQAVERFRSTCHGAVLAVTCDASSPLARQADWALVAPDAQEQSVAQTRSFTSMLLITQALAALAADDQAALERLYLLPAALEALLGRLGDLPRRLGADPSIERWVFLGGGTFYGLANECALKVKEMSLTWAEAYHPLEFRHGPIATVDRHTLVVALLSEAALGQEIEVLRDVHRLEGRTMALVEEQSVLSGWRPDFLVALQSGTDGSTRGVLCLPVVQLMAFWRALARGLDPDRPRHLRAVVQLEER